ncbi:DUF4160 domain-containing protein [Candidatus Electronema sp. TJ]|uniref:DUF4160 domain-containing protein n=1 Tax=Candidatus Electronema sp. TJ TaxID=3401573 RepID=UPI003AA80F2C
MGTLYFGGRAPLRMIPVGADLCVRPGYAAGNTGQTRRSAPTIGRIRFTCAIEDGRILAGSLPKQKMKLVEAWLEIHREDLLANWKLAVAGEPIFRIDPLR